MVEAHREGPKPLTSATKKILKIKKKNQTAK
jgi:hypothetical protein